jgi:probable F420-dependent oxidoreductase
MEKADLGRVGIWAGQFDDYPVAVVREAARTIEDLGYRTLWFPETTGREAMTQAAILLAATRQIIVAAGAADIYARDAVTAAAAHRTLDEAFAGRFLLGLWESHPMIAEDVRGHRYGPPVETMRAYLDAMDAFRDGGTRPRRLLAALGPAMLRLAAERTWGAHPLGLPVAYTRKARAVLGPDPLLAVVQIAVVEPAGADLARSYAAATLPNRRPLLRELGFGESEIDELSEQVVDAIVARGSVDEIAERVDQQLGAGADHVSLYVATPVGAAPPVREWRELAARLPLGADAAGPAVRSAPGRSDQ